MRKIKIHHVDSFTKRLFGGNPAGVVLNAEILNESEMKQIAREMNLSETSFLLPSKLADFRLRFFTPQGSEIKFCGHATLGTLAALAKDKMLGMNKADKYFFRIETAAGILPVAIDLKNPHETIYVMDAPKIDLVEAPFSLEEAIKGLGISSDLVDFTKPLMIEKTNSFLYFSTKSLVHLGKISYDLQKALQFTKQHGIVVFCALTPFAFDPSNHVHARGFAPLVGLAEDPFTGAMQGGLAAYLVQNRMIPQILEFVGSEQGHFMSRPGQVTIELIQDAEFEVKLHARAVTVFSGEIELE